MTPAERMTELIEHGAVIEHTGHVLPPLTLAAARWDTKPTRLRWCAIFPIHQGHVHELRYTRAVLVNGGRDILFYRGKELVAGVVPYEEGGLDVGAVRDARARWRALVAMYDNRANFERFFDEA